MLETFKRKRVWLLVLSLLCGIGWSAPLQRQWYPLITFEHNTLKVVPAPLQLPTAPNQIKILHAQSCQAKVISPREVKLSKNCEFLSGSYSFALTSSQNPQLKLVSRWILRQTTEGGEFLLVYPPMLISRQN